MKLHVLSGGRLRMKKRIYMPDADRDAYIELPVSCFLLRHPQGNVLFDTGCHPSVVDDAEARWGGMAKVMQPIFKPEENVVDQLRPLGVTPDDIDLVVNSHFHSDHCGCNEFFRNATVTCHHRELEAAKAPDAAKNGFLEIDWKQPTPIAPVDGERDVFGDGRLVLIPLPGHTPGSMGGLVALERSGPFLLAADAAPLRANLDQDVSPLNSWDADMARQSMKEIRHIEAKGATVLCGHDAEQWGRLQKGVQAYD